MKVAWKTLELLAKKSIFDASRGLMHIKPGDACA